MKIYFSDLSVSIRIVIILIIIILSVLIIPFKIEKNVTYFGENKEDAFYIYKSENKTIYISKETTRIDIDEPIVIQLVDGVLKADGYSILIKPRKKESDILKIVNMVGGWDKEHLTAFLKKSVIESINKLSKRDYTKEDLLEYYIKYFEYNYSTDSLSGERPIGQLYYMLKQSGIELKAFYLKGNLTVE